MRNSCQPPPGRLVFFFGQSSWVRRLQVSLSLSRWRVLQAQTGVRTRVRLFVLLQQATQFDCRRSICMCLCLLRQANAVLSTCPTSADRNRQQVSWSVGRDLVIMDNSNTNNRRCWSSGGAGRGWVSWGLGCQMLTSTSGSSGPPPPGTPVVVEVFPALLVGRGVC